MGLVGSFPFNSFLSGVLSCIGTAVLAVTSFLRLHKYQTSVVDKHTLFLEFLSIFVTVAFPMLKIPQLPLLGPPPILKSLYILFPIKYIRPTRNGVGANLITFWNQFTPVTQVTGTKSCESIPKASQASSNLSSNESKLPILK